MMTVSGGGEGQGGGGGEKPKNIGDIAGDDDIMAVDQTSDDDGEWGRGGAMEARGGGGRNRRISGISLGMKIWWL